MHITSAEILTYYEKYIQMTFSLMNPNFLI